MNVCIHSCMLGNVFLNIVLMVLWITILGLRRTYLRFWNLDAHLWGEYYNHGCNFEKCMLQPWFGVTTGIADILHSSKCRYTFLTLIYQGRLPSWNQRLLQLGRLLQLWTQVWYAYALLYWRALSFSWILSFQFMLKRWQVLIFLACNVTLAILLMFFSTGIVIMI